MAKDHDLKIFYFKNDAFLHVQASLMADDIKFITSRELMEISEEDVEEFLGRDPKNGYFKPEQWAKEVYENFIGNQTYYFDKLERLKQSIKAH